MEIVYAKTNAEFLNKVFGTDYKAWMKCIWEYDKDTMVWMVEFDGKARQGWVNTIVDANTVREEYIGAVADKLVTHTRVKKYRRIVVKKEREYGRYIILGTFYYDFKNSIDSNKRIWIKTADEIIKKTK